MGLHISDQPLMSYTTGPDCHLHGAVVRSIFRPYMDQVRRAGPRRRRHLAVTLAQWYLLPFGNLFWFLRENKIPRNARSLLRLLSSFSATLLKREGGTVGEVGQGDGVYQKLIHLCRSRNAIWSQLILYPYLFYVVVRL